MPPRVPTLRGQLLTWLLVPLFLLLSADAFVGYWTAAGFSQRAHDRSLLEIARELTLRLRNDEGRPALDVSAEARRVLLSDPVDAIHVELADAQGRHVAGAVLPAPAARDGRESLYNGHVEGAPVRIAEVAVEADASAGRPAARLRVAETMRKREALAREILVSVLVPQVLLVVIAGAVVWQGVVHGLKPLERLQRALAARSDLDRSPVPAERVPGELRPLLQAVNDLLARLDTALTLQSRFVADAAHQLKTPVAALGAQLELALRQGDAAQTREALRDAGAGLARLQRLVSQLLSLARNEPHAAGAARLVAVDLDALALEAASAWVPEALARGIDLGLEPSGVPALVQGDAARLRELLDNLLDNAVRYTRDGGRITVRVRGAPRPTLEVSDDGPSIPPEERERVFQRFHRLLGQRSDGSGLGLAIAREIARIHGAEITLQDDADGEGNVFAIAFPPCPAG